MEQFIFCAEIVMTLLKVQKSRHPVGEDMLKMINERKKLTLQIFTCSNSTIKTIEKGVKYVKSEQ